MADYLVDIVDEHDRVVNQALKSEAHQKNLLHRIIHIYVSNDDGEILLQARQEKDGDGCRGILDASVGGHVDAGETYLATAQREMVEELGVSAPLTYFCKINERKNNGYHHVGECFLAVHNGPFTYDSKETLFARFYSMTELKKMVESSPEKFTPAALLSLREVLTKKYG